MSQPHQSCDRKPSHLNTSVLSLGLCGWRLETGDVTRGQRGVSGRLGSHACLRRQTGSTRRSGPEVSICIDALSECRSDRSQEVLSLSCVTTGKVLVSFDKLVGLRKMSAGRKQPRERNFLPFMNFGPTAQGSVLHLSGMMSNQRRHSLDATWSHAAPACPFPHSMFACSGSAVSLSPHRAWDGAKPGKSTCRSNLLTS